MSTARKGTLEGDKPFEDAQGPAQAALNKVVIAELRSLSAGKAVYKRTGDLFLLADSNSILQQLEALRLMVKGNKFKPFEPPKKRQKRGHKSVLIEPLEQHGEPAVAKATTLLEALLASRPADATHTRPHEQQRREPRTAANLVATQKDAIATGGTAVKKRLVEGRQTLGSKRQKLDSIGADTSTSCREGSQEDCKDRPGNTAQWTSKPKPRKQDPDKAATSRPSMPAKSSLPSKGASKSHRGKGKGPPDSRSQGRSDLSKSSNLAPAAPLQKPATKPTANQRKRARQRAFKQQQQQTACALPLAPHRQGEDPAGTTAIKLPQTTSGQPVNVTSGADTKEPRAKGPQKRAGERKGPPSSALKQTVVSQPSQGARVSSNWAALKAVIGAGRKDDAAIKGLTPQEGLAAKRPQPKGQNTEATNLVAVDCEMVGVGPHGIRSSLARVCIVNEQGNVLLDKYVRQKERVTDYRTRYSGIHPQDVTGSKAEPFAVVQKEAADLFKGRVLVGHALQNDLKALLLSHPVKMIRDTAKFPPLMKASLSGSKPKPRALRHLAFEELGLGIQEGEHSPVEDARCALYLYQRHAKNWEVHIKRGALHLLKAPGSIPEYDKKPSSKTLEQYAAKDFMVDL